MLRGLWVLTIVLATAIVLYGLTLLGRVAVALVWRGIASVWTRFPRAPKLFSVSDLPVSVMVTAPPGVQPRIALRASISFVGLALCFLACGLFIFLLLRPITVVRVNRHPLQVLSGVVVQGKGVSYLQDYCKYSNPESTRTRELVSADDPQTVVGLTPSTVSLELGCHISTVFDNIPTYVPPGRYKLRIRQLYHVYRFRDVPLELETEPFLVVAAQ